MLLDFIELETGTGAVYKRLYAACGVPGLRSESFCFTGERVHSSVFCSPENFVFVALGAREYHRILPLALPRNDIQKLSIKHFFRCSAP